MKPESVSQIAGANRQVRKALEVNKVSKTFYPPTSWLRRSGKNGSGAKQALNNLSLEVNEGEIVGLLGPNGAGKTTLSKIITTLIHPSEGEVRLFGVDVRNDPYAARGMMGLVTCDERSFYWRLTGRQNLRFFGALYGVSEHDIEERSAEILATLDLTHAADRPYHSYSSGMKQKLAIARGLLSHPRLLIYDEPTRSLDPLSAHNIRSWIQQQRKKYPEQTHLLATNQLIEAELLCDRVFIIYGGKLVAQGTVEEIRALADLSDFDEFKIDIKCSEDFRPSGDVEQHPDISRVRFNKISNGASILFTAKRGGDALNAMLQDIIKSGGLVISCTTKERAFDDVFCSVIESEKAHEVSQ
jgi:ABC-2 type transport system ATP-binding protein